ncbi:hypothetical protein Csp2054_00690 [Curtobacterium sp. 'Ferrero']|nr:hypothetical protein Csp2054_00690 [Curtobacterium sp. 'Ferrero']
MRERADAGGTQPGVNYPGHQDIHPGSPELSDQQHPATPTVASATAAATLDDRYGRTPSRRRRSRALAIAAAVAIVVVFAVWVVWAGPGQTSHGLDSDDVGYKVLSDHTTVVRSQVSVDPGTRADCAVQVLDKSYTIVGWKVVDLPASDQRSRTISTEVRTTTRGVTGLIHDCWVP